MNRKPDGRATIAQRLEDQEDAITEGIRLQTCVWVGKLRRGDPTSERHHTAIIAGIAGGILDELWEISRGDPEKAATIYASFATAYFDRGAEDAAADAEEVTTPPEKAP